MNHVRNGSNINHLHKMNKAEKVFKKIFDRLEIVNQRIESLKEDIEYNEENQRSDKNYDLIISLNSWLFEQYTLQELLED